MEIVRKAMSPLYGLMLFGAAFFGLMAVVGVVQARRKREKAYYLSTTVSSVLLVALVLLFLNQFVVVINLVALTAILSLAGLPKLLNVHERELAKQLQETDFSAPLKVSESLTWKGWFKLVSRWGIRKTMCFYSLIMTGVGAAIFFTSSIFGIIRLAWATAYTVIIGIGSAIFFHRQVGKALEKRSLAH